jgi:hypothetical protein
MKNLLLTIVLALVLGFVYGQQDNCDDLVAGQLTVNTSCTPIAFNSTNSTDYWDSPAGCSAADEDDAWGWFIATSTSTTITYTPTTQDAILTLLTGACSPTMGYLVCSNIGGAGVTETITYATTIGTKYRVRIQRNGSNNDMNGTICVYSPITGDNCTNAQDLSTLTSPYSATTVGYADDISVCHTGAPDRIFYIQVPNCNTVDIWQSSNTYDSYHYMGYGPACPGATSLFCVDDVDTQHNSWTNSTGSTQTVWFVVDGYSGTSGAFVLNWTLTGAGALSAPTAATHTPSGTQIIWDWNNVTSATGYKWNTVNNYATATDLGNVSTVTQTGLTCGSSYTIYVWAYNSCGNSVSTTLNSTLACPATNNLCANATSLPCGTTNLAGTTVGTTNIPDPIGCASNYGVWYTFPGDGQITTITCVAGAGFDHEMVITSGSCGTLTNITCQDNGLSGGTESYTFTSVIGTTYYVYIAHYSTFSSTTTGSFTISRSCVVPCNPYTIVEIQANGSALDAEVSSGTLINLTVSNSGTLNCSGNIEYYFEYNPNGTGWVMLQNWSTTATASHTVTINTRYRIIERCSDCITTTEQDAIDITIPSCSDGIQNQGETGVDCGGPCGPCGLTIDNGNQTLCTGTFTDAGGSGFYSNNENYTATYCSNDGQSIIFSFTSFDSESLDHLKIYNGTNNTAPLLLDVSGHSVSTPFTVSSSNVSNCLTFVWTSDGSITYSGWAAEISCGIVVPTCSDGIQNQGETGVDCGGPCAACTMVVPSSGNNSYTICSGHLYDSGGSAGNYVNNNAGYTVLYPTAGNIIQIAGTSAGENCCDYVEIYNGVGTAGTLLGTYYMGAVIPNIISSDPTGALTVYFDSDGSTVGAGFDITISCIPLTGPCANRIEMTCGNNYSGTLLTSNNDWTNYTSCGKNEPGDEVVYFYTPPATANYTFSATAVSGDPDFFLMNSCDNTSTNVYGSCWDAGNITVSLTANVTYYIIIDNYSSTVNAGYTITVNCPDLNPDCSAGDAFCTSDGYLFPAAVNETGYGDIGCLFTTPNPAWYYMEIDNSGDIVIDITSGFDVDFIAWGPFSSLPQACAGIPMETCSTCPNNTSDPSFYPFGEIVDCSYDAAAFETVTISGAQTGEIYVLLITNYSNNVTDIEFSQTGGTGTTNCGIVAPPIDNNGPLCIGNTLQLTVAHPVVGATYSWSGPGGWTSSLENPTIANVTEANAGIYSLVITLGAYTSNTVTTTVIVQTPATTGLANGDYVWSGLNSTDWTISSNWLKYNGSIYSIAPTVPVNTTNVFLRNFGTCASNVATIGASSTGNCKNLTNETALIMGASSLINVYGNWTCTGAFTAGTGTATFLGTASQSVSAGGNPFYNFTVNKTGANVVTALQNVECQGNFLTSNATSIFNSNGMYITVAGNFVNATGNTTFSNTGATGTLAFNGAAAQSYTQGTAQLDLNNVVMNNTSTGLTLLSNMFMKNTGVLTLTSGIIHTGAFWLQVGNTAAASVPIGSSISFINGNLRRYFASNTNTYAFPVGVATAYRLAEIVNNNLAGITYFESKFITPFTNNPSLNPATAIDAPTLYSSVAAEGIWQINPNAGPSSGNYSINLWFDGGGSNAFAGLTTNMFGPLKRPSGSTSASDWTALGGTLNAGGTAGRTVAGGYARRNGWTTFSEFAIGKSLTPLPVELISFNGYCNPSNVELKWSTAQEMNNDYFSIEQSMDGVNYLHLANISGAGNSNVQNNYNYFDYSSNSGIANSIFYRLKQTDFDGKTTTSETITVHCSEVNAHDNIFIINQPESENIQINFTGKKGQSYKVTFIDYLGRTLTNKEIVLENNEQSVTVDKIGLAAGLYHLIIQSETNVYSKQVVVSGQ